MSVLIDDETLKALELTDSGLLAELAVVFYQQGRFSLGRSAEFARLPVALFLRMLAARGVPITYDESELEKDLATLEQLPPE